MRVDLFDFILPEELIALRPADPRDSARLLVVEPEAKPVYRDCTVGDLGNLLRPGDALVVNNTKVLPARLSGIRVRDGHSAKIEVNLHKRDGTALWHAFVKPAKKLREGEKIVFSNADITLSALVKSKGEGGEVLLEFDSEGEKLDTAIETIGRMPLPPYIESKRIPDEKDAGDYQTIFAERSGAVAAPTASLHFTQELIAKLLAQGVEILNVTLHVGAGTFLPVKCEDTQDHKMHAEWGEITEEVATKLNIIRASGGQIIAAGTTSLRILETAASADGSINGFTGETSIFIEPGYRFKCVDRLLTNFHLPRSTLFMLVCAFAGLEVMQKAYARAIDDKYRFYSYGDACLLSLASRRESLG